MVRTLIDINNVKSNLSKLIVIVLLLSLIAVITIYIISNFKKKKNNDLIEATSISARIYIIDPKNNKVLYFNKSDLPRKIETDLNGFYSKFHPNDVEKVKNWILSICLNEDNAEQYIEADIITNRNHKTYFSLLKLTKYNKDKNLIHIESHLLKYITPNSLVEAKKKNALTGILKRSVISTMISKSKSLRGYTFAIRFYCLKKTILTNEKIEQYMIKTIKNEVYPFADNPKVPRQILENSDTEIILFDLRIVEKDEAMVLANSLRHAIRKAISINGYNDNVSFSIGIVENAQYYQDFDVIVAKAQEACINAQQKNEEIYLYQKTVGQMLEIDTYNDHVEELFQSHNLRYLFRPIVDSSRHNILGYFSYVKGYNTPFTTFLEMSKYAARVGKNRELFSRVARYIIPKFNVEKPNDGTRLFMQSALIDLDHMSEILPQIPETKNVKLVILFDEQDVNDNSQQMDLFNQAMQKLHNHGYELGLLLKDKNLLLNESIYTNYDYFVVGSAMISEIKKDNRIRLSIHSLIESLLKYNKPIIATDLEGWQSIELMIKSGVNKLSSEIISSSNDMLLPIEKKKMDKLVQMDNNFH